ncbi:MAG: translation initiation factor IF-2 [Muribaculaceae bacterium]|nr:translation initiation factor IF-2 [Muribaculaceae bacterium]
MPKINKVAKELNVGVKTAVEFLAKHGIQVSADPNARIDDAAVNLLNKEFSTDQRFKAETDKYTSTRRDEKKASKTERVSEASTEAPTPRGPKILGKIDLSNPGRPMVKSAGDTVVRNEKSGSDRQGRSGENSRRDRDRDRNRSGRRDDSQRRSERSGSQQAQQQKPVQQTPKPAQQAPKPQQPKPVQAPKPAPAPVKPEVKPEVKQETPASAPAPATSETPASSNVFRLNTPAGQPELRVVGKIDLAALNQSTRPKKKSKEERRRERIDKSRAAAEQSNTSSSSSTSSSSGEGSRRRRSRIGKEKVDIEKAAAQPGFGSDHRKGSGSQGGGSGHGRGSEGRSRGSESSKRGKKREAPQPKPEVSSEDVQKQVKETLARLTNKQVKKSVKWRKEKREEMHNRELEKERREEAESRIIKITEFVTANDLANLMEIPVNNVIATCMNLGVMVSINQRLDAETINIVAEEFGFTTEYVSADVTEAIATEEDAEEDLQPRPPIVTVMGHVDHGKTSLLDYIRNSNVIAGEAGGITQHIGAYNVKLPDGRRITFLDTPGHEAFTAMRARGAKVTDLAIIIVAADDDVMPQTVEAINHATAAGVPMVFAINKIDKPAANPDKIKEQLAAMNYLVEDWGGKYQSQDISAKKGIGVEDLMEKVLLEAEMLDLRANPNRLAIGSVIESSLDKGRGYVATVLVQNGTLHVGDVILAGTHHGKIKAMFNERNQRVKEAGPSTPVLILGLNGAPTAGDTFNVLETEQEAREIAGKREQLQRELGLRTKKRPGLEELGRRRALNDFHELNLVVKGDVDGSVEALSDSLIKLSTPEIQVNVLHKGVGAISESDVTLAAASDAIIIGFQVRPSGAAKREADKEGVEIRLYSVIYKAIEEVKDAMEGLLAPEIKEEIIGNAEVLQTYHISKVGTIAGAIVRDGKIKSRSKVRVIRDGIVVYTGELGSLKRFKDDVKEVVSGYDCGLSVQGYNDIREGDLIEAFEEVEVKKIL